MEAQSLNLLAMVHLIMLSLWGGVVATEAVIEVYPLGIGSSHFLSPSLTKTLSNKTAPDFPNFY